MMNTLPAQVERHVCSLHARELQYIVHQFQQQFGIGVDDACILLLLRSGQLRIVHQQIGKTRYGIERCTYLMAHVVQERLFQFGMLCQTTGTYQFLFMVLDVLNVLQHSSNDMPAACGCRQRTVTQFPPFVSLFCEIEAVLPFVAAHSFRRTIIAVEPSPVVRMDKIHYLVQSDTLTRVMDNLIEVRVADNPLTFHTPYVCGTSTDGKCQRLVLVTQGVQCLVFTPALHGKTSNEETYQQQQKQTEKGCHI